MYTTTINPLSSLERRLRFRLNHDEINDRFERNAAELAQEARLPGFRPGKVPRSLIKDRYREEILKKVHTRGVREAMDYTENLEDQDVWKITRVDIDEPDDLTKTEYLVDFVVQPVFDLSKAESLQLCVPVISVDQDFLTRGGLLFRYERAEGMEVNRPVQVGDRVSVEIEDIASKFTGDIRGTYAAWAQDYLGNHEIVVDQRLYEDDQVGSLLHEELLGRSVGEKFIVDKEISKVPLGSLRNQEAAENLEINSVDAAELNDSDTDSSTGDDSHTQVATPTSIFSWLDSSRLPDRHLHVTVKISKIEEISDDAVEAEFFARADIPYENAQELEEELQRYFESTIPQSSQDAKHAQVAAQICAMNPIDLPYRVLVGERHAEPTDESWSELGSTFVPDWSGFKPSMLTRTYFALLERLFVRQYASDHKLEPSDDLIAEHTRVEYERLRNLGQDADQVFDPEYQNFVRGNVMRERVMTDIFERSNATDVEVRFIDFYYLSRSGLWTLPPDGGPFTWTSPVNSEDIKQTLEMEARTKESKQETDYREEHEAAVNEQESDLEKSDVEPSHGNVFTKWFRSKFKRTNVTKVKNED